MRLIRLFVLLFVMLLAAVIVVPLVALAGLFIWLKLTEEADDDAHRAGDGFGRGRKLRSIGE